MNKEKNPTPSQGLNLGLLNTSQMLQPLSHQDSLLQPQFISQPLNTTHIWRLSTLQCLTDPDGNSFTIQGVRFLPGKLKVP